MEEKINLYLVFTGILSVVLTASLTVFMFHRAFDQKAKRDAKSAASVIAKGYGSLTDYRGLSDFYGDDMGIALISPEGLTLFESGPPEPAADYETLPEIRAAFESGSGEATGKSKALGYNTYYYALLLEDGNVLWVAMDTGNMFSVFNHALPAIITSGFAVLLLSVALSVILSKKIVRSIETMAEDLDNIVKNVPYKELLPFAATVAKKQQKARENEKMRQEFTANVSHELKTPLTSISGYAEMIENGMAKSKDLVSFAGKIHNEAGRLISLIGDIIKLSELDSKDGEESFERVDLFALAENIVETFELNLEKSDITLSIEGEEAFVLGDRKMLEQVIYNLCDNAIRYNRPKGAVRVFVSKETNRVALKVSDTGIGIAPEHQSRIFERFYRVDKSRSKETGGTGLGLAIVKHAAMWHKARVLVTSQPEAGTTIEVIFKKA